MSNIGFKSLEGAAYVGGRERHYCDSLCRHVADGVLDLEGEFIGCHDPAKLRRVLGVSDESPQSLRYFLFDMGEKPRTVAGVEWYIWTVGLNTVMAIGSDALKLCARVHAQCEIHGYVEGPNRAWLAGIIERGLETRVLRRETQGYGKGWEDVAALLRSRDDGPVVMEYSVTDSFPRFTGPFTEDNEAEREAWYDLPPEEKWRRSMEWLRGGGSRHALEMRPDDWDDYHFGDGRTVFDMLDAIRAAMSDESAHASEPPR